MAADRRPSRGESCQGSFDDRISEDVATDRVVGTGSGRGVRADPGHGEQFAEEDIGLDDRDRRSGTLVCIVAE